MVWTLLGFALIALLDLTPLIQRRNGRAIAAFITIFAAALLLAILLILNVKIPGITMIMGDFIKVLGLCYPD